MSMLHIREASSLINTLPCQSSAASVVSRQGCVDIDHADRLYCTTLGRDIVLYLVAEHHCDSGALALNEMLYYYT